MRSSPWRAPRPQQHVLCHRPYLCRPQHVAGGHYGQHQLSQALRHGADADAEVLGRQAAHDVEHCLAHSLDHLQAGSGALLRVSTADSRVVSRAAETCRTSGPEGFSGAKGTAAPLWRHAFRPHLPASLTTGGVCSANGVTDCGCTSWTYFSNAWRRSSSFGSLATAKVAMRAGKQGNSGKLTDYFSKHETNPTTVHDFRGR